MPVKSLGMLTSLPTKEYGISKWQAMFGHSVDRILAFLDGVAFRAPQAGDVVAFNGERWTVSPNATGGAGGTDFFQHDQPSPAPVWTINHNLGRRPSVTVRSVGGLKVEPDILHVSDNQVQILFSAPFAGGAYFV